MAAKRSDFDGDGRAEIPVTSPWGIGMLLFETVVSRKTPLDGRLEIPGSLADRLASTGEPLSVVVLGEEETVQLDEMACTCSKAGSTSRVIVRLGMSIAIVSPVSTRAIAPPAAASGET